MPQDWREELQTDRRLVKRVVKLRRSIWRKWRILARDKEFVQQTLRLRHRLKQAFAIEPEPVKQFFRSYALPTGSSLSRVEKYLKGIERATVRDVLRGYVTYVARFGVTMHFRNKAPHFRTKALPPFGAKFHAKILEGHLRPYTERGGPYIDEYETNTLKVPSALMELMKAGEAKFTQIDDEDRSSALTEMEAFAYHADGLTFILHQAELPYVFCLIGEKASSTTWRAAAPLLHELQRKYYSRVNAGRPADIKQMLKVAAALNKSGSAKTKAAKIGKTDNPFSIQSAFSSMKKKLT